MHININFQTHSSLFVKFRTKLFVLMFTYTSIGKWHKLNSNALFNIYRLRNIKSLRYN